MTATCREGLSEKWSIINRSLTGVGRSGSCLQTEVLMASPTPCILSSSFAFPLQKNVYPPFGSAIEPSSASLVSLRAAMSIWYLPSSLCDEGSPPFGPRRGIPVEEDAHFPCAEDHVLLLLLLTLTTFRGKTASRGRIASFGFRMSFLWGSFYRPSPHVRVSSATLKRAAQTPCGKPDLLCHPVRERTICYFALCPSPQGFCECTLKINLCGEMFKVGGPLHRDDPTLSASEVRIQFYREPSLLRTSLAAVDGHDVCSALPCPLC